MDVTVVPTARSDFSILKYPVNYFYTFKNTPITDSPFGLSAAVVKSEYFVL